MQNSLYLLSGAAVGIAAATFLILMPSVNSKPGSDQHLMFTAELNEVALEDRQDISSPDRTIRVILPSPYAAR
jgi:hypothetical protein